VGAWAKAATQEREAMVRASGRSGHLLGQIRAGMAVYDRRLAPVGTVVAVHGGGEGPMPTLRGQLAAGAVEIEAGPAGSRCYAGGDQIAEVYGERVLLNVGRDYLATP
jgi:hypothetical protein